MGIFKAFDMPSKEPGESLNTADRLYLIKLIVVSAIFTASLSIMGTMLLLEYSIHRMDKNSKAMLEWSKKADFANEMLEDMFRVQQMKESYKRKGVGADEAIINNNNKKEVGNE